MKADIEKLQWENKTKDQFIKLQFQKPQNAGLGTKQH